MLPAKMAAILSRGDELNSVPWMGKTQSHTNFTYHNTYMLIRLTAIIVTRKWITLHICLYAIHRILSHIAFTFQENREFVFIIIVQFM